MGVKKRVNDFGPIHLRGYFFKEASPLVTLSNSQMVRAHTYMPPLLGPAALGI